VTRPSGSASSAATGYAKLTGRPAACLGPGELDDALTAAIAHAGPSLVEVVSDPELI